MTLEEALKRCDEDEELWMVPTLDLGCGSVSVERRDEFCLIRMDGTVRAGRPTLPEPDHILRLWARGRDFSLVRIRDGRWERV